jgi:hypothetical protein
LYFFSPYSEANDLIFDWHYQSTPKASATAFWQFLFVKHQTALASHYLAKEANDIPPGWYDVTRRDALKNLREIYRIEEDLSDCEGDQH